MLFNSSLLAKYTRSHKFLINKETKCDLFHMQKQCYFSAVTILSYCIFKIQD